MLVNQIYDTTIEYGKRVGKSIRKKIGQFFTPPSIANYMASLMECNQSTIRILDTGAGTGILTAGLCERFLEHDTITHVHIDLYENDENVLSLLRENMELVRTTLEQNGKIVSYTVFEENFILSHDDFWNDREEKSKGELYDVIISNPPYKKIAKSEPESVVMDSVVHGQPNIYFLFMAMAAKLLKPNGELIFITPRSFTSGLYFRKFREYFLNTVRLTNIHLFHSRLDVFDGDKVLQEAIILRAVKTTQATDSILISASQDMYTGESFVHEVPYGTVVDMSSENLFMLIPSSVEEVELLTIVNSWDYNLIELGYKLKTGPVVDFRALDLIKEESEENTVPLLWANHFENNRITFPVSVSKNPQYIVDTEDSKSVLLPSRNYLLVKRFTSKEERRRVQCSLYFADEFINEKVGVENHLNYITKLKGEITKEEMYGLFVLFNSSYIDIYYRILNGSTQVNATEFNAIPLPSLDDIIRMGKRLLETNSITTETCDTIIEEMFIVQNSKQERNVG
ncbi:N-6 DNA methylase [Terrilactibacillus sp. BCM23-1]|uniref:site-specific DNA-methyltransferase (adenine-specific) n=1 Tax=Terrilactibacillus tamarindi TaxID=2599694 RepID=A0A6N8CND8_9BACI|nr:Eco57I restriction-modification methylase domain-containing protein [Terrilactibacillus tamarindi]MTT31471.1 N-6 DNA methylase [Terrilactibacillus tamarindi]